MMMMDDERCQTRSDERSLTKRQKPAKPKQLQPAPERAKKKKRYGTGQQGDDR